MLPVSRRIAAKVNKGQKATQFVEKVLSTGAADSGFLVMKTTDQANEFL